MTRPAADVSGTLVLGLPAGPVQVFALSKARVVIGRSPTSDIVLRDSRVLRTHARVECSALGCEVVNLGPASGLRVNGVPVARAMLAPGDVLGLGDTTLRFERAGREPNPDVTLSGTDEDGAGTRASVYLPETALPRLAVYTSARTWEAPLAEDRLTIGRHPDSDIVLESPSVSLHHGVLERLGNSCIYRDLRSELGTWFGNRRVSRLVLEDGDTFQIGRARLEFKRGFVSDELGVTASPRGAQALRRPVVVVPGFAGSNLWRGSEQVWPMPRMVLTLPALLHMREPLEARGLVNQVVIVPNLIQWDQYAYLVDFLHESLGYETGNDLLEFGYDFRQDSRASAGRLATAIENWDIGGPITIVAHSMGCLVARYYIECLGGKDRVERVILLGGPHAGAPDAIASLVRGPNLLPFGLMKARLRDMLATYPSWYQILPLSALADESWVPERQRPLLRNASAFRAELGNRSSVPSVCVFGYGFKTITDVTMTREPLGGSRVEEFIFTDRGDGMIPEASAVMPGAKIHPVRQRHSALFMDADVKMRLKLELTG